MPAPGDSRVMLGGGWKQFEKEEIPKEELYTLIWETLGINKTRVHEFFGAAEHPVLHCSCKKPSFSYSGLCTGFDPRYGDSGGASQRPRRAGKPVDAHWFGSASDERDDG